MIFKNCPQPAGNIEKEKTQSADRKLTVFYDGACPLCLKEIGYYQRKDHREEILWLDVNRCDQSTLGSDLNKEDALKRFHVRSAKGELISGGRAFAEIWRKLPGFKWLGRNSQNQIVGGILEFIYRAFLLIRPSIQRLYRMFNS
jgi:predicted DCC family thiol-disulfide oxidoreductase YuxK